MPVLICIHLLHVMVCLKLQLLPQLLVKFRNRLLFFGFRHEIEKFQNFITFLLVLPGQKSFYFLGLNAVIFVFIQVLENPLAHHIDEALVLARPELIDIVDNLFIRVVRYYPFWLSCSGGDLTFPFQKMVQILLTRHLAILIEVQANHQIFRLAFNCFVSHLPLLLQ